TRERRAATSQLAIIIESALNLNGREDVDIPSFSAPEIGLIPVLAGIRPSQDQSTTVGAMLMAPRSGREAALLAATGFVVARNRPDEVWVSTNHPAILRAL